MLIRQKINDKPKTYLWLCEGAAFCGGGRDTTCFESESSMDITSMTSLSCWESVRILAGLISAGGVTGVIGGGVSLNKMIQVSSARLRNPFRKYQESALSETYRNLVGVSL